MCIVPLSLLQANHLDLISKAIEYIVAYYEPLRSYCIHYRVDKSNILIIVPFSDAVAIFKPFGHNSKAQSVDL